MNLKKSLKELMEKGMNTWGGMWHSSYENANYSPKRSGVPGFWPRDTKLDMHSNVRRELVRRSRYHIKNSGLYCDSIKNMALYSIGDGITSKANSSSIPVNSLYNEYFRNYSKNNRCEITRRFSFEEVQHLICQAMDVDGEIFIHKTRDANGEPIIQLIETHRVGNSKGVFGKKEKNEPIDGIIFDEFGAPMSYRVIQDDDTYKDIPAASIIHIYEPESVSAVRATPTAQHALNNLQDIEEILALEKNAVKDNSDVSRTITTERGEVTEETNDFNLAEDALMTDMSQATELQKIVGGKLVILKPGEKLESFESKRPSPAFTGFIKHLRKDSCGGMLPYEFVADSSEIGGAGIRLIVARADRRVSYRQLIIINRFMENIWTYIIGDAIDRKLLPAVKGWYKVTHTTPKRVTVDAGRDQAQNRNDIEARLISRTRHFSELGLDAEEEDRQMAIDERRMLDLQKEFNLPTPLLPQTDPQFQPMQVPGSKQNK